MAIRNSKLLTILTLVILNCQLSLAASEKSSGLCGNPYDVSTILKTPKCEGNVPVIFFSEDNHYSMNVERVKEYIADLSYSVPIFRFSEEYLVDTHTNSFSGLDIPEVKAVGVMNLALETFRGLNSSSVTDDKMTLRMARRFAQKGFTESLFLWPEILAALQKQPLPPDTLKFITQLGIPVERVLSLTGSERQSALTSISDSILGNVWLEDKYPAIIDLGTRWQILAQNKMKNTKDLEFLASGPFENVLGWGRSIIFSKTVLKNYCQTKKYSTIFIEAGEGHESDVTCLLKTFLPDGTKLKVLHPHNFEYLEKPWANEFQTSDAYKKLNQLLQEQNLTIKTIKDGTITNYATTEIGLDKSMNDSLREKINRLLIDNGYFLHPFLTCPHTIVIVPPKNF